MVKLKGAFLCLTVLGALSLLSGEAFAKSASSANLFASQIEKVRGLFRGLYPFQDTRFGDWKQTDRGAFLPTRPMDASIASPSAKTVTGPSSSTLANKPFLSYQEPISVPTGLFATPAVFALNAPNDTYYADQWGLSAIDIEKAWDFNRGAGITIAVIDTGLDFTHPDIASNIWYNVGEIVDNGIDDDANGYRDDYRGWDFSWGDNDPTDDNGHGTHVAGISSAARNNAEGISGVAPESKVMAVKVVNDSGGAVWSDIIDGIYYAANQGARVINLSLGGDLSGSLISDLKAAIDYARTKGAFTVTAAGNNGSSMNIYPALLDNVISVGSMDSSAERSYFSSYGSALDVMAPGSNILSLKATGTNLAPSYDAAGKYMLLSGTSMATPMVAGLVALMLAENPLLSFDDIYRRLKYASTDRGTGGFDSYYGYGLINPFKALSEDYYEEGHLKRRRLPVPDAEGVVEFGYYSSGPESYRIYFNGVVMTFFLEGPLKSIYDPSTGIREEYYLSGALKIRTQRDGSYQGFYESGSLEMTYDAGTGITEAYYLSGILRQRILPDGSYKIYFEAGPLQVSYSAETGITEEYYLSGILSKRTLPDGSFVAFYESGRRKRTYDAATLTGKEYYSNGTTLMRDFRSDGSVYFYSKLGRLISITNSSGDVYEFYASGNRKRYRSGDGSFFVDYVDEAIWTDELGFGYGRRVRTVYSDGRKTLYRSYWEDTRYAKTSSTYQGKTLIARNEHFSFSDGLMKSTSLVTGTITHYSPMNLSKDGIGRAHRIVYKNLYEERQIQYFDSNPGSQRSSYEIWKNGVFQGSREYHPSGIIAKEYSAVLGETKTYSNQSIPPDGRGLLLSTTYDNRDYVLFIYLDDEENLFVGWDLLQEFDEWTGSWNPRYERSYSRNGRLYSINDTFLSEYRSYHPNGEQIEYLGLADGSVAEYDELGRPVWIGLSGIEYKSYDSFGRVTQSYHNLTKEYRYYYPNGNLREILSVDGGERFFNEDGSLREEIPATGYTSTFYSSGNLKSRHDFFKNIIFNYLDEDFYGGGVGRLSRLRYYEEDILFQSYWEGTDRLKEVLYFDDWNPGGGAASFYEDGSYASVDSLYYETTILFHPNGNRRKLTRAGYFEEEYLDEDYYKYPGLKKGRVASRVYDPQENEKHYYTYWPATDRVKTETIHSASGEWLRTVDYYPNSVMASKIVTATDVFMYYRNGNWKSHLDLTTNILTKFNDDYYHGYEARGFNSDHQRGSTSSIRYPDGREYQYINSKENLWIVREFLNEIPVKEIIYDPEGNVIEERPLTNEYEYYPSTNIKQKWNVYTLVTEEYLDENYYGTDSEGHGRGRVASRRLPDQSESQFVAYWGDTDFVKTEKKIQSGIWYKTSGYSSSGVLTKDTFPDKSYTTYFTSGEYKGYRQMEVTMANSIYFYEYATGSEGEVTGLKKEFIPSLINLTTLQGETVSQLNDPVLKFNFSLVNSMASSHNLAVSASGSDRSLRLNLLAGTKSSYEFNGNIHSLGLTLKKAVRYNAELQWQADGIGIYIWESGLEKPLTASTVIADRSWDPRFEIAARNSDANIVKGSSGVYVRSNRTYDSAFEYQSEGVAASIRFKFVSESVNNELTYAVFQKISDAGPAKAITYFYQSGRWFVSYEDLNGDIRILVPIEDKLAAGVNYASELRIEQGKANLYVYAAGTAKPLTPLISMDVSDAPTQIEFSSTNAVVKGKICKNITPVSSDEILGLEQAVSEDSVIAEGENFLETIGEGATVAPQNRLKSSDRSGLESVGTKVSLPEEILSRMEAIAQRNVQRNQVSREAMLVSDIQEPLKEF